MKTLRNASFFDMLDDATRCGTHPYSLDFGAANMGRELVNDFIAREGGDSRSFTECLRALPFDRIFWEFADTISAQEQWHGQTAELSGNRNGNMVLTLKEFVWFPKHIHANGKKGGFLGRVTVEIDSATGIKRFLSGGQSGLSQALWKRDFDANETLTKLLWFLTALRARAVCDVTAATVHPGSAVLMNQSIEPIYIRLNKNGVRYLRFKTGERAGNVARAEYWTPARVWPVPINDANGFTGRFDVKVRGPVLCGTARFGEARIKQRRVKAD